MLKDPSSPSLFQETFKKKVRTAAATGNPDAATVDEAIAPNTQAELVWSKVKCSLLDADSYVFCPTKIHRWKSKTWRCNECVKDAAEKKLADFKAFKSLKKFGAYKSKQLKEANQAYQVARHMAGHILWLVKSGAEKEKFTTV